MPKSKEFDNALNECLERLLVRGEAMEQCLRGFAGFADELRPMLETALAVRKASVIQPRPEFRERARYQLYSALEETERKRSRPFLWGWQPRWAVVVAAVLAFLMAGSGTVAAASGSMPDEPLYAVKLATERVQLTLTPSSLGKAELYAKLADKRVLEIVQMASESKPEQIERAVQRLDSYLTEIAVLSAPERVEPVVAMAPVPEEAVVKEEGAPGEAEEALEALPRKALVPKEAVVAEEAPLLSRGGRGGGGPSIRLDRRGKLRVIVAHNAIDNPARLRALLQTVPKPARASLLRAITVSETGYARALESLD